MKHLFIVLVVLFISVSFAEAKPHHPHGRHYGYRAHVHPRPYVVYAAPPVIIAPPPPPVYIPRHYRHRHGHPMPMHRGYRR